MTESTYEVVISRYFDAPPETVYQAFTDPEQLTQWFAPLAFHVPRASVEVDARAGGHWNLTMVSNFDPAITSPVHATFVEVVENKLLVGYEVAQGIPGLDDGTRLSLSMEFSAEGEGTRLELRQGPFGEQTREMATIGWTQSLFKLDALLATPAKFRTSPDA